MTASAIFTVKVVKADKGTPIAVTFDHPAAIPDNAPAGTLVANVIVATSDGSPFTGHLTIAGDPIFAVAGMQIVLARALTQADDGPHNATVTAMLGPHLVTAALAL